MTTKGLQKESVRLKCPHCKRQIESAWVCKIDSFIGVRYAFLCDSCQKLLGVSSNRDYTHLKLADQPQTTV